MGYGGILSGLVQGYGQAVIGNEKRQYEEKQKQKQNDLAMYQNMLATAQSPEQAAWAWQKYDEIAHGTGGKASSKPSLLGGIGKLIFGGGGQQQSQQGSPGGQQSSAAPQAPAQPVNPPGSAPTAGQPQPGMAASPGLPVSTTPVFRPQLTPPLPPRQQAQAGQQQGLTPPGTPNFAAWQASVDARTAAFEKQKSDSAIATYGAERGIDESNTAKREERQAKQQADTVKVLRQAGREADIADFIERKKTAESILGHPLSDEQNTQSLNTFLGIKRSGGEKILGANIAGKDIPDGTADIYGKPINKSNTYRKIEQDGEFKGYQPVETAGSPVVIRPGADPQTGKPVLLIFDKETGQVKGKAADIPVGYEVKEGPDGNFVTIPKQFQRPTGGAGATPPPLGTNGTTPKAPGGGLTPPPTRSAGGPPAAVAPSPSAPKTAGGLSQEALDLAAQKYLQTGQMTTLGYGKSAATQRAAILNRAAELERQNGGNSADLPTQQAAFHASSQALGQLEKQKNMAMAFESTTNRNLDIVQNMSNKVDRTGSPILNKYALYLKGQVAGDADTQLLKNSVISAANEYAKVISGSTGSAAATDASRREAEELLNASFSKGTTTKVIAQMKQEMENRRKGFDDQLGQLRQQMRGNPARPKPAKPGETITADKARSYLDMAGGNADDARKLAAQDGWTIK